MATNAAAMPQVVAQELAPVKTELASGFVGEILEPALDLALIRGLRQRIELAVRYHLCWHRRRKRRGFRP